jgi:hypothetical protein
MKPVQKVFRVQKERNSWQPLSSFIQAFLLPCPFGETCSNSILVHPFYLLLNSLKLV